MRGFSIYAFSWRREASSRAQEREDVPGENLRDEDVRDVLLALEDDDPCVG
jgi:hypothetical protein